ncbi:STAS domain-containing protein [Micromonospora sp. DR5-3]|uniref:STAS domain-containing protein n=1 Tax=unclassified Micromonospora TaxID=2617518 RepID=UPI0011D66609|nr:MULTISPECIES: STAS domain-containing protein [unclassified Micromonospora]MCW3818170.1 STAS domain-containing protein [Micromonospora sp. DR5-3]TYC21359.1 STAS domain-containing protein [Micromonospora sp. MP36]
MTGPQPPPPDCTVPLVEVEITEELDRARLSEVSHVLDRILSLRPGAVVIDLSGCRHVDAAGIGLLLDLHRRMTRRQGTLKLRDPNPRIRRILEMARLDQVLPILDTSGRARPEVVDQNPTGQRPAGVPVAQGRAKVAVRS